MKFWPKAYLNASACRRSILNPFKHNILVPIERKTPFYANFVNKTSQFKSSNTRAYGYVVKMFGQSSLTRRSAAPIGNPLHHFRSSHLSGPTG